MGNNPKKVDRYSLEDWQFAWPDVGAMARWRPRIQSSCPLCSTRLWIPLKTIRLTLGDGACLWGLELPCNRVGCEGWRSFRAWVPEANRWIDFVPLRRAQPAMGEKVENVGRYVEPRKSVR